MCVCVIKVLSNAQGSVIYMVLVMCFVCEMSVTLCCYTFPAMNGFFLVFDTL